MCTLSALINIINSVVKMHEKSQLLCRILTLVLAIAIHDLVCPRLLVQCRAGVCVGLEMRLHYKCTPMRQHYYALASQTLTGEGGYESLVCENKPLYALRIDLLLLNMSN